MNKDTLAEETIGIITVCRNDLEGLKKTLDSVLSQTYRNKKVIIVDGNSDDGTKDFLENLDDKSIRYISEPDKGIYDAMNKGVDMADCEWLIFMNANDIFAGPDILARLHSAALNLEEDTGVIYGDVIKSDSNGNDFIKKAERPHDSHRMFFCHQSAMIRRKLLLENPYDINHRLSADFKFFKILIKKGVLFEKVDFPIARFDTSGISNSRRSEGLADNIKVILEVNGIKGGLTQIMHLLPTYILSHLRGK